MRARSDHQNYRGVWLKVQITCTPSGAPCAGPGNRFKHAPSPPQIPSCSLNEVGAPLVQTAWSYSPSPRLPPDFDLTTEPGWRPGCVTPGKSLRGLAFPVRKMGSPRVCDAGPRRPRPPVGRLAHRRRPGNAAPAPRPARQTQAAYPRRSAPTGSCPEAPQPVPTRRAGTRRTQWARASCG